MSQIDNEKAAAASKGATDVEVSSTSGPPAADLYDPSKEHWMTRAGLNFESYKRAPGTTAYVPSSTPSLSSQPWRRRNFVRPEEV